ncbi:hypothetical protein [Sphingopyxis yananensis]|uniref:hypothetical protein n=1 Tax=Sphingopyxis yananensis TaxID=2886687 RepID=UPI001D10AAF5|nr:hypothetical protein [Sphingopyxis yananensis]MCC2602409.1 hypothetical protein [Sphingopyxis yananensis]
MQIIRTFEQLAGSVDCSQNTEIADILNSWLDRLQAYDGYDLPELAIICILGSMAELAAVEVETGHQLLEGDRCFRPVETATRHQNWIELVFILSDDGFGVVLLVPTDAEPAFLALCEQAMT